MSIHTSLKDPRNISKIATVIIFLALIRSISEPFRLQYYSATPLNLADILPFLVGSLVASVALFVMTILFYFGKHRTIVAICVLTIISLLIVRKIYMMPF